MMADQPIPPYVGVPMPPPFRMVPYDQLPDGLKKRVDGMTKPEPPETDGTP
jgi:hypothetical protein